MRVMWLKQVCKKWVIDDGSMKGDGVEFNDNRGRGGGRALGEVH